MINFYKDKQNNRRILPRFFYRNFIDRIKENNLSKDKAIELFEDLVLSSKGSDYLKFTWNLPKIFSKYFNKEEIVKLESILKKKRDKRLGKAKKHIYPHVSDEFSLDRKFLESVFDTSKLPEILKKDIFFTMGSCFARNFSNFLNDKGIKSKNLGFAEDLNTPGSNASFLNYVSTEDNKLLSKELPSQVSHYWSGLSNEKKDLLIKSKTTEIIAVKQLIQSCSKIIITLGNTIDFYQKVGDFDVIVPKFISLDHSEDIDTRINAAARIKKTGAYMRMSTFTETKGYIKNIYEFIRKLSPKITIIFTVSPVPIDSVLGISDPLNLNAIEIDCISKSTIRSALYEVMNSNENIKDSNLFYLPSYEIVRWVAPVTGLAIFGNEDAASRHVSNEVLNSVCDFIYNNSTKDNDKNKDKGVEKINDIFNFKYKL